MQLVRRISLVKRVTYGFGLMSALSLLIGGMAVWALQQQAATAAAGAAAATTLSPMAIAVATLAVAASLLSALIGWLTRASIKESVEDTVQCVVRIAGGDLETKIQSPGKDEIAWLRAELNGMRKKLRAMVIQVRETVESVNTASGEIANGNIDLCSRTERQSGALQVASSSMQQLSGNVKVNADSTLEASSLVAQSRDVATRSATVMREAMDRMGEIANSAGRIGDIVGVIDGIAFQTNILALNAAVEAARAGDHGRGFAVVASEVRTLAQHSSTAAREIKVLIGDSTTKVEVGSRLINDAGRTMQDMVDSVARVSQIIGDIAAASQSQSREIGQISATVQQLDTMTQQNAALVEQMSATAVSLKDQSGRLSESVGVFHVVA